MTDLLAEFAKRLSWELSFEYPDDDDLPGRWCVYERRGNRNDQEWRLRGKGATPAEAIEAALKAEEPKLSGEQGAALYVLASRKGEPLTTLRIRVIVESSSRSPTPFLIEAAVALRVLRSLERMGYAQQLAKGSQYWKATEAGIKRIMA